MFRNRPKGFSKMIAILVLVILIVTSIVDRQFMTALANTDEKVLLFTVTATRASESNPGEAVFVEGATVTVIMNNSEGIPQTYTGVTDSSGVAFIEKSKEDTVTASTASIKVVKEEWYYYNPSFPITSETVNIDTVLQEDKEAPRITNVTIAPESWAREKTVTIEVEKEEPGLTYRFNNGPWQNSNKFSVETEGNYRVEVQDIVGNTISQFIYVETIDRVIPHIKSVSIDNENTWTNQPVKVSINAWDEQSGLADSGAYRIDEGEWQKGNEFWLNDADQHTLSVQDKAGNIATSGAFSATHFDNVKPEITKLMVQIKGKYVDASTKVYNSGVYAFHIVATDNKSGITSYSTDEKEWKEWKENNLMFLTINEGKSINFFVKDRAGNISEAYVLSPTLDTEAPVLKDVQADIETNTNQPITYTVTADDNPGGSGIADYGISESDNGTAIRWNEDAAHNTFVIGDDQVHYLYVKDNAGTGNVSEPWRIQASNFCNIKPIIKRIDTTPSLREWTNKTIQCSVIADANKNASGVEFPIVGYAMDPKDLQDNDCWQAGNTFTIADTSSHVFYVKDSVGNISEATYVSATYYDGRKPEVVVNPESGYPIHITKEQGWTFIPNCGNFYNSSLRIKVSAEDNEENGKHASSGIAYYSLYLDDAVRGQLNIPQLLHNNSGSFILNKDIIDNFKGTMRLVVVDRAGNSLEVPIDTSNSNLRKIDGWEDGQIVIDNTPPVINQVTPANGAIYKSNYKMQFGITDAWAGEQSGIAQVKVTVNGTQVLFKDYTNKTSMVKKDQYSLLTEIQKEMVNGVKIANWNNGKLDVVIEAYDNASNPAVARTFTVYVDQTAPVIQGFQFSLNSMIDVPKNGDVYSAVQDAVLATSYGYYFKKAVKVTVIAEDLQHNKEAIASGVATIKVYLKETKSGQLYTVSANGGQIHKIKSLDQAQLIKTNSNLSFVVPMNFKGQIYALAVDKTGNLPPASKGCVYCLDQNVDKNGFVHPNGVITENLSLHKSTSEISFSMPKTDKLQTNTSKFYYHGVASRDKGLDYGNREEAPLYDSSFKMGLNISDNYSGIREIKWTLIEGDKETVKNVTVSNQGDISGDTRGWKVIKEAGSNLICRLENKSIVINGNYNNMTMVVELTDRAGNKTYDYYTFGIDQTSPTIDITYDNNSSKGDDASYFKESRKATIVVTERNFDPQRVMIKVTSDKSEVPVKYTWKTTLGRGNGDGTKHTATILYENDGDYSFEIACTDAAANKNKAVDYHNSVAPKTFIVDRTNPVIRVSYDNNAVKNTRYFKANRTATIVINEHNFDVSKVKIKQTAILNGKPIDQPKVTWSANGDNHVATIQYNADGEYTFDVLMEDKAGNESKEVQYGESAAGKSFVLDKKIDKLKVQGIGNGKAYKGEVVPTISFSDLNFEKSKVVLTRIQMDGTEVDVTDQFIKNMKMNATGGSGTNNTFAKVADVDGIYRLSVSTTDKAGNVNSENVQFTVNRFGSVYKFNSYLSNLSGNGGAYTREVNDNLVINEYNAADLVEGSLVITITHDGKPLENVQYDMKAIKNTQVASGKTGWSEYQYTINKDNFKQDGVYKVSVSSQDRAGNAPENTNYKDKSIVFRVDTTAPELTSITGLEKSIVNGKDLKVSYNVYDTIGIKSITIYNNNKQIGNVVTDFSGDSNNYTGSFTLKEDSTTQKIRIVVEDMAGNITDTDADTFQSSYPFNKVITISTSLFIRWYANTPVFYGTIIGGVIFIMLLGIVILIKRRKHNLPE